MIQYSEQTPIYENEIVVKEQEHDVVVGPRDKLSLSQIWQYLTRTKCLPGIVNFSDVITQFEFFFFF